MSRLATLVVMVGMGATASATAAPAGPATADRTPLTCDGYAARWHVDRARQLISDGYARHRMPDPTPMRAEEKRGLRRHKFCLLDGERRDRIAAFRDRIAEAYHERLAVESAWPTPESVGVSSATLAAIRACESGGDYGAISASGTYRGAYQFDFATWASVGGSGDPAYAEPAEQDYRAALLYARSGPAPWPVCGV